MFTIHHLGRFPRRNAADHATDNWYTIKNRQGTVIAYFSNDSAAHGIDIVILNQREFGRFRRYYVAETSERRRACLNVRIRLPDRAQWVELIEGEIGNWEAEGYHEVNPSSGAITWRDGAITPGGLARRTRRYPIPYLPYQLQVQHWLPDLWQATTNLFASDRAAFSPATTRHIWRLFGQPLGDDGNAAPLWDRIATPAGERATRTVTLQQLLPPGHQAFLWDIEEYLPPRVVLRRGPAQSGQPGPPHVERRSRGG